MLADCRLNKGDEVGSCSPHFIVVFANARQISSRIMLGPELSSQAVGQICEVRKRLTMGDRFRQKVALIMHFSQLPST